MGSRKERPTTGILSVSATTPCSVLTSLGIVREQSSGQAMCPAPGGGQSGVAPGTAIPPSGLCRDQPLTFVGLSLLNGVASEFIGMETSVQCI